MSLNQKEKEGIHKLLNSIKMSDVTVYPISNISPVPAEYAKYEIVYESEKKIYGFSVFDAIKKSGYSETVISLDKNGMNFFYTSNIEKKMLWLPDIRDKIKDVEGTVVVLQNHPEAGQCITKYIKAEDIEDEAIKPFLHENLVIFQEANFYIQRANLEVLADVCLQLWHQDTQKNLNGMTTLQNTTAF